RAPAIPGGHRTADPGRGTLAHRRSTRRPGHAGGARHLGTESVGGAAAGRAGGIRAAGAPRRGAPGALPRRAAARCPRRGSARGVDDGAGMNPRAQAIDVLARVEATDAFLNVVLDQRLAESPPADPRDSGLVTELSY